MENWYSAMEGVAFLLLAAVAESLGLPPAHFHPHFEGNHTSQMRLNHYPACPIPGQQTDQTDQTDKTDQTDQIDRTEKRNHKCVRDTCVCFRDEPGRCVDSTWYRFVFSASVPLRQVSLWE